MGTNNANLVDLDLLTLDPIKALDKPAPQGPSPANPFGLPTSTSSTGPSAWNKPAAGNPFDANKPAAPTLNQLASSSSTGFGSEENRFLVDVVVYWCDLF